MLIVPRRLGGRRCPLDNGDPLSTAADRIGLIGLGHMGLPMGRNLLRAGFDVVAWNRSPAPAEALAGDGAVLAKTPAEVGAGCDVVVTMLPDLPQVAQVCDGPEGVLSAAAPGTIVVVMGTVSPIGVRRFAARLAEDGFGVVDAPVSGSDVGAEQGTLSIAVGGADEDVARIRPALEAMGTTIRHLGPVGAGQLAKACNQVVVAATLTALGEALTLGSRGGLDAEALLEVLGGGLAGSRALEVKRDKLLTRDFTPGGAAVFQHKDLGFALEAARDEGVALPVTAVIDQLFGAMCWRGLGQDDHSGILQVLEALSTDSGDERS